MSFLIEKLFDVFKLFIVLVLNELQLGAQPVPNRMVLLLKVTDVIFNVLLPVITGSSAVVINDLQRAVLIESIDTVIHQGTGALPNHVEMRQLLLFFFCEPVIYYSFFCHRFKCIKVA